jgi:HAD superfamily hydrolase (TIGR01509 family)
MKNHRAAIFDMDGVIIDSGPFHMAAWKQTLERHKIPFAVDRFRRVFGMRDSEVVPHLIGMMSDEATQELMNEKSLRFQEFIRTEARAVPGVAEFVQQLRDRGIQTGLASLARPDEIRTVLETVGLADILPTVITREQPLRDKPAPDIFLAAALRMGVAPEVSVVFEDAISGIEAARAAGAMTVAITTSYSPGELSHADLVINDFFQPTLLELFNTESD